MKFLQKTVCVLSFCFITMNSLFAKENIGFSLQIGASGTEEVSYSYSTISSDSVSLPYTRTVFYPNISADITIPVYEINENCIFRLDSCYDFSIDYSISSYQSFNSETITLFHKFSLTPELSFSKDKSNCFFGAGIAIGFEPYKYTGNQTSSIYNEFKIFWSLKAGASYHLNKRVLATMSATCFYTMFDNNYDETYGVVRFGNYPLVVVPKAGLTLQI